MMEHRHLVAAGDGEPMDPAAIDDLLERGTLKDWRPLLDAIRRDPHGDIADTVERLLDANPRYGTAPLLYTFLARNRARAEDMVERITLRELRQRSGLSQQQLAERMRTTQSEVSRIERRPDLKLSTLRDFVTGAGGRLHHIVAEPDGTGRLSQLDL